MTLSPTSCHLPWLIERAELLKLVRAFFAKHGLVEVDTPVLSQKAAIDTHIDLIETLSKGEKGYLVSSPEYAMKRLLAEGFPNCYQLGHVFRAGENSLKHNSEFTMVEWYLLSQPQTSDEANFQAILDQTLELIQLCLCKDRLPYPLLRHQYWDLFSKYLHLDLKSARQESPKTCLNSVMQWLQEKEKNIPLTEEDDLDDWLSYLISHHLEAKLEKDFLHIVEGFPSSQAALATTYSLDGLQLARRFEIYLGTLELANGYHELTDADEQKIRIRQAQESRKKLHKDPLPMDERFVESLRHLPSCCGVAVGFDRLLMKRVGAETIAQVIPFRWQDA